MIKKNAHTIYFPSLKLLCHFFKTIKTIKNNVLSPPRPSYFVLYNTLESDVVLAYLPMATVTIAVVEMIMSLVTTTKIKNWSEGPWTLYTKLSLMKMEKLADDTLVQFKSFYKTSFLIWGQEIG